MNASSENETLSTSPQHYEYPPSVTVVCPKCGNAGSLLATGQVKQSLDYMAVCGATLELDVWCDAVLHLRVTAHQWPSD